MTLLELCDPLFQYMCQLNRLARSGADRPASQIRADIEAILSDIRRKAADEPGMLAKYEMTEDRSGKKGIELVLIFFADYMIRESRLPCAPDWRDMAEDYEEFGGDDKFFDLLDEALEDRSPEAAEKLAVFYTCLGLGFVGGYIDQPEMIRRRMADCASRLRGLMGEADAARVCPEAYSHTDRRPLNLPPAGKLMHIGIGLAVLVVVIFVVSAVAYRRSQSDLARGLNTIIATPTQNQPSP